MVGAHSQATLSPLGSEREDRVLGDGEDRGQRSAVGMWDGETRGEGEWKTEGKRKDICRNLGEEMWKIRQVEMMRMIRSVDHHLTVNSSRI